MLKDDHKSLEQHFRRFERAGDRALVEKRHIVDRIIEELAVHAAIEEQLFYPAVRSGVPDAEDSALESLEEHHVAKWLLSELDGMSPDEERFDAKVAVLIHSVRHHLEEEEGQLFPKVREELGRQALSDLGEAMANARKIAPTHAHPRAPDTPPGNLVVGTVAGVGDRIRDTAGGLVQGSVTAIGDIVATVLGRTRPRAAPTGSKAARRTASQVRSGVFEVTESAVGAVRKVGRATDRVTRTLRATGSTAEAGAERTARTAKRGGERTARAAKRGGERTVETAKAGATDTATAARHSSKRTATTAKRGATRTRRTAREAASTTTKSAARAARETASTATGSS